MIEKSNVKVIVDYLKENVHKMLKDGQGIFKFPLIQAGAGYENSLWDWDSYWSAFGLMKMCRFLSENKDFYFEFDEKILSDHAKGSVLNFLEVQHDDGFIPMVMTDYGILSTLLSDEHKKGNDVNQHKPFLCTNAINAARFDGDIDFLKPHYNKFKNYLNFYFKNQYDEKSGLFIWLNDLMIGIDNNPAVFGRPDRSTADIYLNCFMYNELLSMSEISKSLGFEDDTDTYKDKAEKLSAAIQQECWDMRDGLFYSVDICVQTRKTELFNHGLGAFWNSIPLKIRTWASFLPMFCGFATKDQAKLMVDRHYNDPNFSSPYGIRTLSADEKMYNTENSSNPSNWLGPIWVVGNYCTFKGLLNYGYIELAADLAKKTIKLLSKDIKENSFISESYVPETGAPMMYGGFFDWNLLVFSMIMDLETYQKN